MTSSGRLGADLTDAQLALIASMLPLPRDEGVVAAPTCAGSSTESRVYRVVAVRRFGLFKRKPVPRSELAPRRRVVERTFAWISRNRRLARDHERKAHTTETLLEVAVIRLMLRRFAPA